jgi:AcrR family transcriptional regulator
VPRPARTQAARRAATRTALIDATVAALVKDGYARLSTRGVAERAGVSQGTLQHHFATKSELVVEALRHLNAQITADVVRRIDLSDVHEPARQASVLDELWRVHTSSAFTAALEVWAAARTDAELRPHVRELERDVARSVDGALGMLLGDRSQTPAMRGLLDVALATVRGFAMLGTAVPQAELDRRFEAAKLHLLGVFAGAPPVPARGD